MTLEELRKHKQEIEAIAAKYGVSNIRVFGSIVRGEAGHDSDVDLLVDLRHSTGWNFLGAKREIASLLGREVDMVDDACIDKYLAPYILNEARAL